MPSKETKPDPKIQIWCQAVPKVVPKLGQAPSKHQKLLKVIQNNTQKCPKTIQKRVEKATEIKNNFWNDILTENLQTRVDSASPNL